MTPREELEALRRLAELEAKARGQITQEVGADPTEGMGSGERFLAGVGRGMTELARGAGQRLREGIEFVAPPKKGLSDLVTGGRGKSFADALGLPTQADIDAARKLDAPLMRTTAGSVGDIAGKIAAGLPTVLIPGAASLTGAAAVGAGQGFLEPTSGDESVIRNTAGGAAAGAGGVIAGRAIIGAAQAGKALLEPFTQKGREQIAGRVLARFADDPSKIATATAGQSVTGATPTLAEVTADRGLARLQDSLRSVDPQIENQIGGRLAENSAARVQALRGLAGTTAERDAAETARKAATAPLYQQATSAAYTIDGKLADLLQRPAVKQAMERAQNLAKNQGRTVAFDVQPGNAFKGLGIPDNNSRQITGQALQDLKMAMDEMLSDPASSFTGKAGNTIRDLRGQLVGWMESANPAYKEARTTFAAMSRPINGMDTGAEILKRATSASSDLAGNAREKSNALLSALRDEQGLIRRGTGRNELTSLEQVFTPDQLNVLRQVAAESDRAAAVAGAGNGPGSATAQRMAAQNVLRQLVGPTGLPTSWAENALANTVIGKPLNVVYSGVAEPKIQQALAEAALNPDVARRVLAAAQRGDIRLPDNVLSRLALQASRVGATAALVEPGQR